MRTVIRLHAEGNPALGAFCAGFMVDCRAHAEDVGAENPYNPPGPYNDNLAHVKMRNEMVCGVLPEQLPLWLTNPAIRAFYMDLPDACATVYAVHDDDIHIGGHQVLFNLDEALPARRITREEFIAWPTKP